MRCELCGIILDASKLVDKPTKEEIIVCAKCKMEVLTSGLTKQ